MILNGAIFQHVKKGTNYRVENDEVINATNNDESLAMILYSDTSTGQMFVREKHEFLDGRFTQVNEENPLEKIAKLAPMLPTDVLEDVYNRIKDWLADGGKQTDPYIYQQLNYARKVAASTKDKGEQ